MRCFIYFYLVFVQFYVGFCNFLELSDFSVLDTLPYVWSNGVTTQLQQTKCTVQTPDSSTTEGTCISRARCLMTGGLVNGHCGLLSTCCTYGRVHSTNAKVSYFSSSDVSLTESPITFNIARFNENVCQLRLDFVEFDLAIPTGTTLECNSDNFYVTPDLLSMPQICGYNTGQHIYVNMPKEYRNIALNVKFTIRTNDGPRWNIKVTQLQCPTLLDKKIYIDKDISDDYSLIAPLGCLQYFTKGSGNIKSFGYRGELGTNNRYVSNQLYSICFKRTPHTCRIQFTPIYFMLVNNPICRDYFIVPDTTYRICSTTSTESFYVTTPAPLNIVFYVGENGATDTGFSIDYALEPCTS